MKVSISAILIVQFSLALLLSSAVFVNTILFHKQSVDESLEHGEAAVSVCFDEYLASIKAIGESFVEDISLNIKNHVRGVVDNAEAQARAAARTVERIQFMEVMETNSWHGNKMLPSFSWTILAPHEEIRQGGNSVVEDIVIATFNSTEEFNNWVWFGLAPRNPHPTLNCDFYYYRNATDLTSSLWCVDDLFQKPNAPSPSIFPHPISPAIVRLQTATPCNLPGEGIPRTLEWIPLNFFISTLNLVALTSVVGGVFGPDGTCQGFAAANVRFTAMSTFLESLTEYAHYTNLYVMLIESGSGQILGTSFGSAIFLENRSQSDGSIDQFQVAASLAQMEHPLARALHLHIEEHYGSIGLIPTPLITTAILEGQEYFLSFDEFLRPSLNLTICAFLPHISITGPSEAQRDDAQRSWAVSTNEVEDKMDMQFVVELIIGVGGLAALATVVALTAVYLSMRITALVFFMEKLRSQISFLANKELLTSSSTPTLCKALPDNYFPVFDTTPLKDLNKIGAATKALTSELLDTWNAKQEVFRRALEQRQLMASIAHDIRNPLHGVLGIVNMMEGDIEEHKDKLPLLSDTLTHMATLLNDVVDLSKIQGGKVAHIAKTFDAFDTLHKVFTLYQSTIASSGGTLSCMERFPLPRAYWDPIHVERTMNNFVSNTSKYAAGGEIQLKAVLATREQVASLEFLNHLDSHFSNDAPHYVKHGVLEQDYYIVLACLDTGQGIPPTKLESVFEAYQQTNVSDTHQGAGLGLAIVKGLAIELDGGVGVQSQMGSGSLFWLVVPCASGEEAQTERPEKLKSSAGPTISAFAGCHALVVDDNKINLMLLRHFLEKLDMKAETFTSAEDGLSKLRQDPGKFVFVISDFNMPGMSGGEMCLLMRSDPLLRHLPFIICSGNPFSKDDKMAYRVDDALMKPFRLGQVRETIGRLQSPSKWASDGNSDTSSVKSHTSLSSP